MSANFGGLLKTGIRRYEVSRHPHRFIFWVFALVALVATGCADSSGTSPDAGAKEGGLPDGLQLYPCENVGQSCSAHNSCAIDPICSKDKVCLPTALQNCDDGLKCTVDECQGRGVCKHQPSSGTCALPVKTPKGTQIQCFKEGDKNPTNPCLTCDPATDPKKWTGANGGPCDDGIACTKDDYCNAGKCTGTNYASECADNIGCTDDLCDGKGGCLGSKLRADYCLIQGECFKDNQKHPSGACLECDVNSSQAQWTNIQNTCHINGKCYTVGEKHAEGCAECDPGTSTSAWTVKGSNCLIQNKCKNPNDKDAIACAQCTPGTDKYAWTPIPGLCKIHGSCFNANQAHPGGCAVCDPALSATTWSVKVANRCLINNVCRNTNDKNLSGCGACEPTKDKYTWSTLAGLCSIDGLCLTAGTAHPQACGTCTPATSSTYWTANAGKCVIDFACYNSGATHPAGCGTCTPATSTTSWTVSASTCLIGGRCVASGTTETGGCGTCDPTKSQVAWTKGASCASVHVWSKKFGNTSSDYPYNMTVDANGNIYVTGYFYNSVNFGGTALQSAGSADIFIASFTPSGKHRWSKGFGGTSSDYGYGVAVDPQGNVYVTGRFYNTVNFGGGALTSTGSADIFVASFTSAGAHRWSKKFGSTSLDDGWGIAADVNGNVYVTGRFYNTINFGGTALTSKGSYDIFVASLSTTGTHRWSKSFGSTSSDYGYGIAVDSGGNSYVTGYFYNTVNFGGTNITSKGSADIFLASFNATGGHRWSKGFGSTSSDYAYSLALDKSGNVAIAGSYFLSINFGGTALTSKGSRDGFVAAFTSAGGHRWSKTFGGTSSDYAWGVTIDNAGNTYVTGYFYNSASFGGVQPLTSAGSADAFVASYNVDGAYRWARGFGSTSSDQGRTVAVDAAGNVYAAGIFYNTVNFGGGPLTSTGSSDDFIVKLSN